MLDTLVKNLDITDTESVLAVAQKLHDEMYGKRYAPCPCCVDGNVVSPLWVCKCGFEGGKDFNPNEKYCSFCAEQGKLGLIEYIDDKEERMTTEHCKLCGQEEFFHFSEYNDFDDHSY